MLQHSQWTIVLNFGVRGDITDVITHIKLSVNRFRGFGAVTPPNVAISVGLAVGSYNIVSTAVLHCETEANTKQNIQPVTEQNTNHQNQQTTTYNKPRQMLFVASYDIRPGNGVRLILKVLNNKNCTFSNVLTARIKNCTNHKKVILSTITSSKYQCDAE